MFQTSLNHLNTTLPGTQNNTVEFPQQLSLFFGAAITPNIGTLIQVTYNGASGTIGMDNTDIRFANRGGDFIYGVTLNNNPTVQDVWQTTPAWGFPFAASEVTPSQIASTLVDQSLAQQVLGAGAYVLWKNLLYAEVDAYRSAPQGAATPADSTAVNTINGVSPYWRVALQHQFGADYGEIGTFGLGSHLYPTGVTGATNAYTNVALDAQYEHSIYGQGALIGHVTWITENQTLNAFYGGESPTSANLHNSLETFRANASFLPNGLFGLTLGYFSTTGSKDSLLHARAGHRQPRGNAQHEWIDRRDRRQPVGEHEVHPSGHAVQPVQRRLHLLRRKWAQRERQQHGVFPDLARFLMRGAASPSG